MFAGFSKEASEITGLSVEDGELKHCGVVVETLSPRQAYCNFIQFLREVSPSVVLVAHNGFRFDAPVITRELILQSMWPEFRSVVTGFADTLPLFREKLPDRCKSKDSFKQEELANDLLPVSFIVQDAHNAISDVRVLDALITEIGLPETEIIESAKPVNFAILLNMQKL